MSVCDAADDKPFSFTTGLQSHLACRDLHTHHEFARMLGLGAKHYIDYCPNARKPKLRIEQEDYVNFGCKSILHELQDDVCCTSCCTLYILCLACITHFLVFQLCGCMAYHSWMFPYTQPKLIQVSTMSALKAGDVT